MDEPPRLKFYFDTHISKAVAVQLRLRGVDVLRCEEVSMAEAEDWEHLEYAANAGRAMVSIDRHFQDWHTQWLMEGKTHAGIFRIDRRLQGDGGIGSIVKGLLEYVELIDAEAGTLEADIVNQLLRIG